MCSPNIRTAWDRLLDPMIACLTPDVARRIVDLRLDPLVPSRLDELATKSNDGTLHPDEQSEYQEYVDGLDMLAVLELKAKRALRGV
jgi:hypothetical protein